jgi:AbrB family looped-hinge helix DNA binding protein
VALAISKRESESDRVLSYTQDGRTLVCVRREVIPVTVVKLSSTGQLVIPSEIRDKYDLRKGDRFLVRDVGGKIVLEPLPRHPLLELRGAFKSGEGPDQGGWQT